MTPVRPAFVYDEADAPRLEAEPVLVEPAPGRRWGTAGLVGAGVGVLGVGFAALGSVNFVMDQFARAAWLGWVTAVVAAAGFGLAGAGVWRELRALWALERVDRLRLELASGDAGRVVRACAAWAGRDMADALRVVNDPDAAVALVRAGPGRRLREGAEALARAASVQVVAGIAAVPSPALDVVLVAWRGVRLVRQVAALYGMRPGLLGTVALMRRVAMAATMVGAAELAGNTLAHGLLSNPLLAKALGEVAGAGVAARRMLVLGRAAALACDPSPPEHG